jgi:hypothetical protein
MITLVSSPNQHLRKDVQHSVFNNGMKYFLKKYIQGGTSMVWFFEPTVVQQVLILNIYAG